jgi:transcriptional regulator with XRE-family HTH domain
VVVVTFLTESAQREAFAAWLRGVVARSGKSKLRISEALGYDTTGQLNRYLRGQVFPTAKSAAKIATVCGVWPIEAYWRGGFYRELFAEVTALASTQRNRHSIAEHLLACFPRRGDRYRSTVSRDWAYLPHVAWGLQPRDDALELSDELALAGDIAYDATLPQDARRAIIAEFCDAWARRITSSKFVDGVRCTFFAECGTVDTSESLLQPRAPAPTRKGLSR